MQKIVLFFIFFLFIQSAFCFYLPETFFPGRQSCIYSEKCPKDKPFLKVTFNKNRGKAENIQESEECVGCDYVGGCELYEGHEHDLDICSNRKIIQTKDEDDTLRLINTLIECPPGKIRRSFYDAFDCVPCDAVPCSLEVCNLMMYSNECSTRCRCQSESWRYYKGR